MTHRLGLCLTVVVPKVLCESQAWDGDGSMAALGLGRQWVLGNESMVMGLGWRWVQDGIGSGMVMVVFVQPKAGNGIGKG